MKKILVKMLVTFSILCCVFFAKETQGKSYADRPVITGPTNVTVDYKYDYRDFVIKSSYGSFKLSTNVDWIGFYQTNFTKKKDVTETTPVLYMPRQNTSSKARKATVTVTFTEPEYRSKSYSFTITQMAGGGTGPTIMVGSKTYKNPDMFEGVIRIDYDERCYIDSMQSIMICSPNALKHTAEEVDKNTGSKYICFKTNNCHNDCQEYLRRNSWNEIDINPYKGIAFPASLPQSDSPKPKHIIQIYFSAYSITNYNKWSKWNVVPELKIVVNGEYGEFANCKTITYIIRFTNIVMAEGPTDLRPYPPEVYNPTGNSAGIHGPSSGPNPDEWVTCYYCGAFTRYGSLQSHYENCKQYQNCHNPARSIEEVIRRATDPRDWWKD